MYGTVSTGTDPCGHLLAVGGDEQRHERHCSAAARSIGSARRGRRARCRAPCRSTARARCATPECRPFPAWSRAGRRRQGFLRDPGAGDLSVQRHGVRFNADAIELTLVLHSSEMARHRPGSAGARVWTNAGRSRRAQHMQSRSGWCRHPVEPGQRRATKIRPDTACCINPQQLVRAMCPLRPEPKLRCGLPAPQHAWPAADRPCVSAGICRCRWPLSLSSSLGRSRAGRRGHTHRPQGARAAGSRGAHRDPAGLEDVRC